MTRLNRPKCGQQSKAVSSDRPSSGSRVSSTKSDAFVFLPGQPLDRWNEMMLAAQAAQAQRLEDTLARQGALLAIG